ncbi:HAD family phosphatase [Lentzea alba]|uniref:HAD family hydrolase n=1 Tax=Lentzea alba TaxID=2714351 RepID=UPI0039BFE416
MTGRQPTVDDPNVLTGLLSEAKALILDFDGPICSVFSGFPAPEVARQLREILAEGGHIELPPEVGETRDPFDVLKHSATIGFDEARYIEAALTAHEIEAVDTAQPTERAHELIRVCADLEIPLGIASNNSRMAVEAYLAKWKLTEEVGSAIGRTQPDPALLKPNPHLLREAAAALGVAVNVCVFVGDYATDIEAAEYAKMKVVGFANKDGKLKDFQEIHCPDAIVTNLGWLIDAIR